MFKSHTQPLSNNANNINGIRNGYGYGYGNGYGYGDRELKELVIIRKRINKK